MEKIIIKIKKAFTLAEIMIVFTIIGVVSVITLMTAKPYDKYMNLLYGKAFEALSVANYNIKQDLATATPSGQTMAANVYNTPANLCNALAGWINHSTSYCGTGSAIPVNASATDSVFTPDNVQFITTNSMKVYFVDTATLTDGGTKTGFALDGITPYSVVYRIVIIDLNGDRKPNTMVWSDKTTPDIVAFAITETGDTIPLGYPETDTRYLLARVTAASGSFSSKMSYWVAKQAAWGGTLNPAEIKSINFYSGLPGGSNILIPATAYKPATPLMSAFSCIQNTSTVVSTCKVTFDQYNN